MGVVERGGVEGAEIGGLGVATLDSKGLRGGDGGQFFNFLKNFYIYDLKQPRSSKSI